MNKYVVQLSREAEHTLDLMHKREPILFKRVVQAIDQLERDPHQGKLLKGVLKGRYSYRVGSYRIIYTIQRSKLIVQIIDIGHRRDIYR
ncbi:MAG: mRNA interferase RelE/StbE [Candidatus Omnitrophota bacterium]|jgi:mRNA interferase RelE/StbE